MSSVGSPADLTVVTPCRRKLWSLSCSRSLMKARVSASVVAGQHVNVGIDQTGQSRLPGAINSDAGGCRSICCDPDDLAVCYGDGRSFNRALARKHPDVRDNELGWLLGRSHRKEGQGEDPDHPEPEVAHGADDTSP